MNRSFSGHTLRQMHNLLRSQLVQIIPVDTKRNCAKDITFFTSRVC